MLDRPSRLRAVRDGLKASPAVALLGPRQCGKTTLARAFAVRGATTYFDLEHPAEAVSSPLSLATIKLLENLIGCAQELLVGGEGIGQFGRATKQLLQDLSSIGLGQRFE